MNKAVGSESYRRLFLFTLASNMGPNMNLDTLYSIVRLLFVLAVMFFITAVSKRVEIISCRVDLVDAYNYNTGMPPCVEKLGIKAPEEAKPTKATKLVL